MFSLQFYGSGYTIGREHGFLRTLGSLSRFMAVGMREEENLEPHVLCLSVSFYGSWYATGRERGVLRTLCSLSGFMGVGTR
jgi:hypothetical protein